jgi:DNA-binding Xre family transcriptional regulator
MLKLNLQPVFKARGIDRPYTFLVKAGFTPHSASVILSDKTKVVKLRYIEVLCEHLNCEPNDLLLWIPDKNKVIADNHPLHNLSNKAGDGVNNTLRDLPYKQLKELSLKLANKDDSSAE